MAVLVPLKIVLSAVDRASAVLRGVDTATQKVAKSATKIGKDMTASVTAPIAAVGVASFAAFSQFEQGIRNVTTLVDSSVESTRGMEDAVLAIAERTPVATKDLTDALFDVRSAGVSAADQFEVLERSAQLGVAGLGTTAQAVDLVTSSINAFALEGDDAQKVYDNIFRTTKTGKTTIAGLAQGFGGVASTVAATGTQLDEYLASVAALTTTGLPAAQAHTQLKAVFAGLTRDTEESRKAFKALGAQNFKDLIASSGGMVPALQAIAGQMELTKKSTRAFQQLGVKNFGELIERTGSVEAATAALTGTLTDGDAGLLKLVGSTEALGAILSLTGAQNEAFKSTLEGMRDGTDALGEAFEKQVDTAASQMQITRNALVAVGVEIGRSLLPLFRSLAASLRGAAAWFRSLDDGTKVWILRIAGAVAIIGPTILLFGKFATAITALLPAFKIAAAGIKILTGALVTNPIGAAIALLSIAALLIIKNWEDFRDFFILLWDTVVENFDRIFFLFGPIGFIIKLVKMVIDAWEPITAFFSQLWDGIVSIFESAVALIMGIVNRVMEVVDDVVGAVQRVGEVAGAIGERVTGLFGDEEVSAGPPAVPRFVREAFAEARAAQAGEPGQATVRVQFENTPPGVRAAVESETGTSVELEVGQQLVAP